MSSVVIAASGLSPNTEPASRFPDREASNGRQAFLGHLDHRPPQAPALSPDPGEAGFHSLLDAAPLELGDGCKDVELEPSRRRGGVDALGQADEGDTQRLQFVNQQNQVPKVATESVQSPHDQGVELPALGGGNQLVKGRAPVLGA